MAFTPHRHHQHHLHLLTRLFSTRRHSVVQLGCLTSYLRVLLSGYTFPPPRKPSEMGNSPFKLDFGCKEAEGHILLRAFSRIICLLSWLGPQMEFCVSKIPFYFPLNSTPGPRTSPRKFYMQITLTKYFCHNSKPDLQ